jgi:hypothetical protein
MNQKQIMKFLGKIPVIAGLILGLITVPHLTYAGHGNGEGNKHGHNKHDGKGHKGHKGKHHGDDYADYDYDYHHHYHGPYFTSQRVTIIRNYYTPEEIEHLPPGLRKHIERTGHLPPGLEKKLVVNEPLPPEYYDYMVPAPPELVTRLGPLPPDSSLYLYNGDAVLLNPKTMAVMDIVHGVLTLSGH